MDMPPAEIVVTATSAYVCTPVAVQSGDGPIHCAEGRKVTLAGIAVRRIDGGCGGDACPDASGVAARAALVQLVGERNGSWTANGMRRISGAPLTCRPSADRSRKTDMWCHDGDKQINCEMVRLGYATMLRAGWLGEGAARCRSDDETDGGTQLAMRGTR